MPTISGFTPTSAITGSVVTIEGGGLSRVSEVKFGKLSASFTVVSQGKLEAVVPNGAKPGKITVNAPGGTATSKAKFTPTLSVTAFSPKHGAVGSSVAVNGLGFTPGCDREVQRRGGAERQLRLLQTARSGRAARREHRPGHRDATRPRRSARSAAAAAFVVTP